MLDTELETVRVADSQEDLEKSLQVFAEARGFSSYCFVDGTTLNELKPFHIGTDARWDIEYQSNRFSDVDACIAKAKRTNIPFSWESVAMPIRAGKRKPGALRTMEAAADHGLKEGLVVPFHFVDEIGRTQSLLCAFFWRDSIEDFQRVVDDVGAEIHLYLLYWMQRSVELRVAAKRPDEVISFIGRTGTVNLTDRQKDVLCWAARGKTIAETAVILGISKDTVDQYAKSAITRLGAGNKVHAVAKAIMLRAIEP